MNLRLVGSASAEAQRHWRRVRELLGAEITAPDTAALDLAACTALLATGMLAGLAQAEAAAIFAAGEHLRQLPSANAEAALAAAHGRYLVLRGTARDALQPMEEAVRRAEESGDPTSHINALMTLAFTHLNVGRLLPGLEAADAAVALLAATPRALDAPNAARAYTLRGLLLALSGQLQAGEESQRRADALSPGGAFQRSQLPRIRGDFQLALTQAQQGLAVAEQANNLFEASIAQWGIGDAQLGLGAFAEALSSFQQARAAGMALNLEAAGFSFGSCGSFSAETSLWQSVHWKFICPCTDAANVFASTAIDLPPAFFAPGSLWHIRQESFGDGGSAARALAVASNAATAAAAIDNSPCVQREYLVGPCIERLSGFQRRRAPTGLPERAAGLREVLHAVGCHD